MQASENSKQSQAIIPWQPSVYNMAEYKKLERNHFKDQFYLMDVPPPNSLVGMCLKCLGQSPLTNLQLDAIPTEMRGPIRFYRWLNVNQDRLENLLKNQLIICVMDMAQKISNFIELHPTNDFTLDYDTCDPSDRFNQFLGVSFSKEINEKFYLQVVKITAQFLITKNWLHSVKETEITHFFINRKTIQIEMNGCGEFVAKTGGHYISADHQFYRIIGLQEGWEKRNQANYWTFSEEVSNQMKIETGKLLAEFKIYQQNNPSCWKDFYNIVIEEGPCQFKDNEPMPKKAIEPRPSITDLD